MLYFASTGETVLSGLRFPNAKIVADRFHVIRLLQHQCMMTYRELSTQIKSNRGILALLHIRPDRLTPQRRKMIPQFLNMLDELKSSPFKALAALGKTFCLWKEEILRMWRFGSTPKKGAF
uniref:transposase n=1 Tax=Legionella qingyii TaxID=2184757 RepID=UPI001F258B56|nr:transposase [Legionella qingyii]